MASHVVLHGVVYISKRAAEGRALYSYDVHIPTLGCNDIIGRAHLYAPGGRAAPDDGFYRVSGRIWYEDLPVQGEGKVNVEDEPSHDHSVCCNRGQPHNSILHILFNDLYVEDVGADRLPACIDVIGRVTRPSRETHCADIDVAQYGLHGPVNIRTHCFYPTGNLRLQKSPIPDRDGHLSLTTYLSDMINGRLLLHVVDVSLGPRGSSLGSLPSQRADTSQSVDPTSTPTTSPWMRRGQSSVATTSSQPQAGPSTAPGTAHAEETGSGQAEDNEDKEEMGKGKKRKKT